jgi:hypothetical protein
MSERNMVGTSSVNYRRRLIVLTINILLTKLEFYGVTGTNLKLIKSHLEGRYQKVILDGNLPNFNSDWGEIRHGVPQGSILGPLLFLLYISDLSNIVNGNAEVVLCMDDTSIIITGLNPTDFTNSANKILEDINKWFITKLLSLNAEKTQYMQFVTKTSSLIDLHVEYKNKEMASTSDTKCLALTLDKTFS